jgi:hypothetical protein
MVHCSPFIGGIDLWDSSRELLCPLSQKEITMSFLDEHHKSHFMKCDCYGHLLEVERYNYKDGDEGFNFTMWRQELDRRNLSWKERFRWCWHILTKGTPWADHIIATNERAREVAKFILDNLPQDVKESK